MTASPLNSNTERKDVIERLKNQIIVIPNLLSLLPGWRCEVNPNVDVIEKEFHIWLERHVVSFSIKDKDCHTWR